MPQPCPKCRVSVEDGVPFCPNCNAPQIRVSTDNDAATPPLPPGTPGEVQPPAEPVTPPRPGVQHRPVLHAKSPGPIDWSTARRSAILAGVLGAFGTFIPVGVFITLWMLAAGGISITLYKRRAPQAIITPGNGFRIGALTGVIGFALNAALTSIGMISSTVRANLRASLQSTFDTMLASNPDPMAQETVHRLADWVATPGGFAAMLAMGLFIVGIFFIVIAGIGGCIGATLFGRHEQR